MAEQEIIVPELGDGITGGTIVSVAEGTLVEGDTLIEIETDKAVLPVPTPYAGGITKVFIEEGQEISVGDKIAVIAVQSQSQDKEEKKEDSVSAENLENKKDIKEEIEIKKNESNQSQAIDNQSSSSSSPKIYGTEVAAGPGTRKIARELGVNLKQINGSGRGGRITIDDIKNFVKNTFSNSGGSNVGSGMGIVNKPFPDFSDFGQVEIENSNNLRRTIADHMNYCWSTIPHVHQFQDIDVTEIVEYQKAYGDQFKEQGSAVSVTLFLIKAMAQCLKEFPLFNASYDYQNNQIHYKKYFNIGVAVDTPSGLIVPVLKEIHHKSIFTIGKELKELAVKTRERKVLPKDLQGASITLSNLGGIGGKHFTPIVNSPEVAIVGAGRTTIQPIYQDGEFVPRSILPLCLAYDHRLIDGASGARFTMRLTELLENPQTLLMGLERE